MLSRLSCSSPSKACASRFEGRAGGARITDRIQLTKRHEEQKQAKLGPALLLPPCRTLTCAGGAEALSALCGSPVDRI